MTLSTRCGEFQPPQKLIHKNSEDRVRGEAALNSPPPAKTFRQADMSVVIRTQ
jgi:hypothetical protein